MDASARGLVALLVGMVLAGPAPTQAPAAADYTALLQRLTDVDWLWRPPAAGERCVQWSSYDRAAHAGPGEPGAWYANDDRGKHLRVVAGADGPEHVMVDAKGPGCVARIWSANPSGTLHVDVDGARVWSVDFLALCSGRVDGVPEPLAGLRARGGNCYLPIPFQKSLVVSCTAGDCYYAFDVVQFAPATPVPSFTPALLASHRQAIAMAWPRTVTPALRSGPAPEPRERLQLPAGIVRQLTVEVARAYRPEELGADLRTLLLVVRCGDEETVRVPLADFFAVGDGPHEHRGGLLGWAEGGGYCGFPMPMPEGGVVELVADDGRRAAERASRFRLDVSMDVRPFAGEPLRFRASYHLAKGTPTRPFGDHLVLAAEGAGRFVGCSLLVRNPSRIWWGEGDEKFTVDGEAFPSWFGTGTEDYFGYAWCDPTPFQAPFHAQVQCQGPGNFGFTQLHRTHVLDSVPFQRSCRFDLERWHWLEDIRMDYATVAYWYGAPGATSGLPPVPPAAARRLERLAAPPVFVAEQALEGEALRVIACPSGTHEVQDLSLLTATFSRDAHRWWRDGTVGDALVLGVPVPAAGRYRVVAAMVQADDFGIVQLALGGQPLGGPIDGYAARVGTTGPRPLGVVELPAGEAELRVELRGRNAAARPRHMFGLDWLRLEKLP